MTIRVATNRSNGQKGGLATATQVEDQHGFS